MEPTDQILVCYSGPSGALIVDDVTYPRGVVRPMARSRYLEVLANDALMAEGHSLSIVAEVGPSEAPLWVAPDAPAAAEIVPDAPPSADPIEPEPEMSTEVKEGSEPTVE
jgi:hypothetical protein